MGHGAKIFWVAILFLIVAAFGATFFVKQGPGKLDTFAQCLAQEGAVFYGAFWCPHCQNQKRMFGSAANLLPYVECSTPDGQNRTQQCIDEEIQQYPTWEFADGSRLTGEVALSVLSEKTGCALPEES